MASYHCSMKTGSSGNGEKHADYISREGKYQEKKDLELLEHGNMPEWAKENPGEFWQAADQFERVNGRPYREIEVALPNELTREQRAELVQEFVKEQIGENHPYTAAIHCPQATLAQSVAQPHAHIMFSERTLDGNDRGSEQFFARANPQDPSRGGAKKDRDWVTKDKLNQVRESWAKLQNKHLEKYGHEARVDHRSLDAQRKDALEKDDPNKAAELDRPPESHLGPKVANRLSKEIQDYLRPAKSPQERLDKREEYYERVANEKVRNVYNIREYKRNTKALEAERKLINSRVRADIDQRLGQIYKEMETLIKQHREVNSPAIVSEKAAKAIAQSIHSKGKTVDLPKLLQKLQQEQGRIELEIKQFQSMPKPNASDLSAQKSHQEKEAHLKKRQSDLAIKSAETRKQIADLNKYFDRPEVKKVVDQTAAGILAKSQQQQAKIQDIDKQLESLKTEYDQLMKLQGANLPEQQLPQSGSQLNLPNNVESLLKTLEKTGDGVNINYSNIKIKTEQLEKPTDKGKNKGIDF